MRHSSGGIRHGKGRGHNDPPEPSHLYCFVLKIQLKLEDKE